MISSSKVTSLSLLRGLAVILVCLHHFSEPITHGTVAPEFFRVIGTCGRYGVQIFFAISGFVIPYSLYQAKYSLKDYFPFLYKRVLRLHPPYLVALLFTLLSIGVSYHYDHLPYPETPLKVFQYLFYIHFPKDNPVFWTLSIEFQYYIFIGLFFVLMTRYPKSALIAGIPLLALAGLTPIVKYITLFSYIPFFLIGTTGYMIYIKKKNVLPEYLVMLALLIYSAFNIEPAASLASALTVLFILFYRSAVPAPLEFLGEISYSLYLIHFPIGLGIIHLLFPHLNPSTYWVALILAIAVCISLGYLFWRLIEKPSARLSNKVKYGKAKTEFQNFSI